ncbi:MAG: hypothetical protein A2007_04830, partial [Verrucomicrobia bacterium GWC2_42_7]
NLQKIRKNLKISPEFARVVEESENVPTLFLIPHFSLMEMVTLVPALLSPNILGKVGVIYRPFENKSLERWVKKTRERFGLSLLSRKQGFSEAQTILENKGKVVVLFDQNAGFEGKSILFFEKIASVTELPGILAQKYNAKTYLVYPKHKGFWKAEVACIPIEGPRESLHITLSSNQLLEDLLKSNDSQCADWLWLHNRWKTQMEPARYLQLFFRKPHRNGLQDSLNFRNQTELRRRTQFWIRMPNWLGDVIMAIPLLRAIRAARPDAEISLLIKQHLAPLFLRTDLCDNIFEIPPQGPGYFKFFWDLRKNYPQAQFLFTNSLRGDIEARLIGAPQRFGLKLSSFGRPLLNQVWEKPSSISVTKTHQTLLWEKWLKHFGLNEKPDFSTLYLNLNPEEIPEPTATNIGLICGTENFSDKRWPIKSWQLLINRLLLFYPHANILLFGTKKDASLTNELTKNIPSDKIINLAGTTDLVQFAARLLQCKAVIGNDTGGIHLANALGIPVCVLYGPTNPIRTGPIFDAPKCIIQPQNCPPTGGLSMELLHPDAVFEKFNTFFSELGHF